jgi:hypothetical protein
MVPGCYGAGCGRTPTMRITVGEAVRATRCKSLARPRLIAHGCVEQAWLRIYCAQRDLSNWVLLRGERKGMRQGALQRAGTDCWQYGHVAMRREQMVINISSCSLPQLLVRHSSHSKDNSKHLVLMFWLHTIVLPTKHWFNREPRIRPQCRE